MIEALESSKKAVEKSDVTGKLENFENMIQKFVKIYSEEVMTFSAKVLNHLYNDPKVIYRIHKRLQI